MIEESTKQWIKERLIDSEFLVEFTKKDGTKRKKVGEVKSKVKTVRWSVIYMKAIKALQEAMTRIESLEAEVKALKGE